MKKTFYITILAGLLFYAAVNRSGAAEISLDSPDTIVGIEYLFPVKESRDIRMINADYNWLITEVGSVNFSLYAGLTASYATGSITQMEGGMESATLREVRHDNSAFGFGPGLLARFRIWSGKKFLIHLNGSGNTIFYNQEFPAGGDFYNFMWRGGPSLEYGIDKLKSISVGYHWTHLSNGQSTETKNPSYDAQGIMLRFSGLY